MSRQFRTRKYSLEYILCRKIAYYIRAQYPNILFHFDYAGNNLSKAQSGMMKAIQGRRGWPDLFIAEPGNRFKYHGLFIEIKAEGTRVFKKNGQIADEHLKEQYDMLLELESRGYMAEFAVGFDQAKQLIDKYLKL
jgi:hypothetical protein